MPRGAETVRVVRKPKVDKLKPSTATATEFDVDNCHVLPRSSNEQEYGWVQIEGFTVVAPGDADIREHDQLQVRDELHSVIGKPGQYRKGGRPVALMVTTERVSSGA